MRRRNRVLVRDAFVAGAVFLLIAVLAFGGWRLRDAIAHGASAPRHSADTASRNRPSTRGATSGTSASAPPALGLYTGPGAATLAQSVNSDIGGKVTYALDFQPASTWTALSDPSWLTGSWASAPFHMVVAVPMLPSSGGTLAQGATGAYDGAFTLLAQHLVSGGLGGAVLMVGWQPESSQNPWHVTSSAQATLYVAFWDHIHAAMAAVPGSHFQFEWDAGEPGTQLTPAKLYPGNQAVDIVAEDAFDVGLGSAAPQDQWTTLADRPYGPSWAASFAARHGKQFALGMCGLVPVVNGGAGDNPTFLTAALEWARAAHATMVLLWDYASWSVTGGAFPQADAALVHAVDQGIVGGSAPAAS